VEIKDSAAVSELAKPLRGSNFNPRLTRRLYVQFPTIQDSTKYALVSSKLYVEAYSGSQLYIRKSPFPGRHTFGSSAPTQTRVCCQNS
jgi:hypothetical protein